MKDANDSAGLAPLATAAGVADWWAAVEDIAEMRGYFDPLGPDHAAMFSDGGETLLVTFEAADTLCDRATDGTPLGWALTAANGWSSLVLLSTRRSWFRAPEVFAYFDRLVDDGFFDGFERVIFFGAGPAGYAAAAYSVTAPGATLIAVRPQASLTPAIAGWDSRAPEARRIDFTSRYGYAPHMAEAAARAFVLYDPGQREDAMHAQLFAAHDAILLPQRLQGADLAAMLCATPTLAEALALAGAGQLDAPAFARLLRASRRRWVPYLRARLERLDPETRPRLTAGFCRTILSMKRLPRFRRALAAAEAVLAKTR